MSSGVLSGAMGIALNLVLFAAKLIAAIATGSVAVIADAFNNLGDAGSSVVTMVGFKLANKKPDIQHPFGHGRIEYITGFIVSVVIIIMGFELGLSSAKSIGSGATPESGTATVVILCASVLVKLYMALYNYRLSKFFSSAAMKATCTDSLADAISTTAVLLALLISKETGISLDSYMGLLVSVFILYSGVCSARDTIAPLLGVPPEKEFVDEVDGRGSKAKLALGGTSNILNFPEYNDVEKAKSFLSVLETKEQLMKVLESHSEMAFTVRIGAETGIPELADCSLVTAAYRLGDHTNGTIGVIGPTRMQYGHVLSVLNAMGRQLSELLGEDKE